MSFMANDRQDCKVASSRITYVRERSKNKCTSEERWEDTASIHIAYLPSTCRQSMGPTENRATLFWRNEVNMRRRT